MPQPRAVLLDGSYSDGEVNDLGNYTPENGDKPDRMMVQLTLASERSSPRRKSQRSRVRNIQGQEPQVARPHWRQWRRWQPCRRS